jgi:hypothetical protein
MYFIYRKQIVLNTTIQGTIPPTLTPSPHIV